MQYIRSVIFVVQMYLAMVVAALVFGPWALFSRTGAYRGVNTYCRYVRWTARVICGLHSELRGPVPHAEVLIASKHQSFFDIIILCSELRRPKFIMKDELRFAPILGWYAQRIGCVPVKRGKRAAAMRKMVQEVTSGTAPAGQLVIYPQGTRVAPRVKMPYKTGTAVLYHETGQPCVPAATNVGLFWPRRGMLRKPGLAVVEFLETLPPGLPRAEFMATLEDRIETASDRLMDAAEGRTDGVH
ncbi:lysophospholipid acyltransferase family protein [Pseudooceanicola sp. 502str34]